MLYEDILLIAMGFVALVMIVMAVMMGSRPRKSVKKVVEEEPKPEKILVEKGFERTIKEEPIEPEEEYDYTPVYIEKPATPVMDEPPTEEIEEEPTPEPEPIIEEPEPVLVKPEPVIIEPIPDESFIEPEPDETVEITPVEPMIFDTIEIEEKTKPDIMGSPSISEPDEEVAITPNQTFYDPIIIEPVETRAPTLEESPSLDEEEEPIEPEHEIEDIPEIELPPLEPEEPEAVPEEIEPEVEEEPEPEPVVPVMREKLKSTRRVRKPIIDESDPDLKIDLGVEKCPHCGSKVPATIYCINCGKPLDPERAEQQEEEV